MPTSLLSKTPAAITRQVEGAAQSIDALLLSARQTIGSNIDNQRCSNQMPHNIHSTGAAAAERFNYYYFLSGGPAEYCR
jgi:hypothetical protein